MITTNRPAQRYWWSLLLRGILALVFGILAFIWPGITLAVLVLFFGAYVLLDGVFAVIAGIEERNVYPRWWVLLIDGILGIVIGVLTFFWPGVTALVLIVLVAVWAIFTGIFEIIGAIWLRNTIRGEGWLALAGIFSVVLGILILFWPRAFALTLVWLIAAYAVIYGISLIIRAFSWRPHLGM